MPEALPVAPVNGAPIISPASSGSAGEPSFEQLAALLPEPSSALPGAERAVAPPAEAVKPEPTEGEETPAEPEAEAAPAVDKDALERAEAAAKKAREGSRRYREALESQRRVQAEAARSAREAAEYRRQAEEAAQLQQSLRKDPYAALKKLGMTDHELAERALREGTPENEMRVLLQQQQETIAAERQARQQLEQRLEADRQAVARQQAEANFARIADNEGAYPRLAQLSSSAQLAVAQAALQQITNNGYDVSALDDEQVAEACERFLAPKRGAKAAPAAKLPPPPAVAPAKQPANTTLTNQVANARATQPRPWEELTDDEQIAQIAASLPDPA